MGEEEKGVPTDEESFKKKKKKLRFSGAQEEEKEETVVEEEVFGEEEHQHLETHQHKEHHSHKEFHERKEENEFSMQRRDTLIHFQEFKPIFNPKTLKKDFEADIILLTNLIDKLNYGIVQKWKKELLRAQNYRSNNSIFEVRGEMYSLFGYTVLNKLMVMKTYWLGQMFTNLKILDVHLEALETYLEYLKMKISQANDENFRNLMEAHPKAASEDLAMHTLKEDHCASFWENTQRDLVPCSQFAADHNSHVILNGDISFTIKEIIENDSSKVHELMAKIVVYMKKISLPVINLPVKHKDTKFERYHKFNTEFGYSIAWNLTVFRDLCFKDINQRIFNLNTYAKEKTRQLRKFEKTFNSMNDQFDKYEISCLHQDASDNEIGVRCTPAIDELERIFRQNKGEKLLETPINVLAASQDSRFTGSGIRSCHSCGHALSY
ncbi:Oidioi.mRNA.OKI2018_I69.chr1.g1269.t1.cds [Oikopleura dioica]|uniref:Oidioi.mRNA.OKI2018_I69.chr1.g1269.t1.cds n=1 Tax=Oikopleura dioica TaxID=34765 RepID=A0ABN7SSM1_OIKDI|nr:Oidioi.mRNA.OKI2018_I69.chr1.g1269.t1.cds [Oikopleura dioica]